MAIWTLLAIKQDSRDRTRPVLIAELKRSVLTAAAELHVRNVGQSVACNVSVKFDPEESRGRARAGHRAAAAAACHRGAEVTAAAACGAGSRPAGCPGLRFG